MSVANLILNQNNMIHESTSLDSFLINEAFYGKKDVSEIQTVLDKIYSAVMADPKQSIYGTSLARELESAVQKVFGFKSVSIIWSNRYGGGRTSPYTMPSAVVIHGFSTSLEYGSHQNGFYDTKHELMVYIQLDQSLFSDVGLTSEEMCGILLHEIGHNFDYSPANLIGAWFRVIMALIQLRPEGLLSIPITEWGRPIYQAIRNIDTFIQSYIPPIGILIRLIGKVRFNVIKFLRALLSPVSSIVAFPIALVYSPTKHLEQFFTRKKEVYADSFAAAYGYASEVISALEKMYAFQTGDPDAGPIMQFFYDFTRFQQEYVSLFLGGHGSDQKRLIKMIDKLEQDLKDPRLDSKVKAELIENINDARKCYDDLLNIDKDDRNKLTGIFRRMVDNWYAGKPYMIIPSLPAEYAE